MIHEGLKCAKDCSLDRSVLLASSVDQFCSRGIYLTRPDCPFAAPLAHETKRTLLVATSSESGVMFGIFVDDNDQVILYILRSASNLRYGYGRRSESILTGGKL